MGKKEDTLILDIVTASMDSSFRTVDKLFGGEREHRQALEVLISDVLANLENAHMGSAREYERAVAPLRRGLYSEAIAAYADRHPEREHG